MKIYKKITATLLVMIMLVMCVGCSKKDDNAKKLDIEQKVTVNVWYSNSAYTPYIEFVAGKLNEANELITVNAVLADEQGYVENVYNASVNPNAEDSSPIADVYLLNSDDLQKAYLAGITAVNDTYASKYTTQLYGNAAITACSYDGRLYGYPFSFNTGIMVYNKKYVSSVDTFTKLTDYSNSYKVNDTNKDVQLVATWDVSDMLTNYAFVAPYINIGGNSAEDKSILQINSQKLKEAMSEFYKLKEAYGISRDEINEDYCIDKFKEGKLLYTIIESDRLSEIDKTSTEYGICKIPALNSNLESKSLSKTVMAMVNPYTKSLDTAKVVAQALSYDYAEDFYQYTGCVSARNDVSYAKNTDSYKELYSIYSDSCVKAKYVGAAEMYLRYEILLHDVWDGKNTDEAVENFQNMVKKNIVSK